MSVIDLFISLRVKSVTAVSTDEWNDTVVKASSGLMVAE